MLYMHYYLQSSQLPQGEISIIILILTNENRDSLGRAETVPQATVLRSHEQNHYILIDLWEIQKSHKKCKLIIPRNHFSFWYISFWFYFYLYKFCSILFSLTIIKLLEILFKQQFLWPVTVLLNAKLIWTLWPFSEFFFKNNTFISLYVN